MTASALTNSEFRFPRNGQTIVIGRDESCDVVLRGAGVSRRHALLQVHSTTIIIEDAGSSFGVFVNGQPVRTMTVAENVSLTIGVCELKIVLEPATATLIVVAKADSSSNSAPAADVRRLRIGRDPKSDLPLDHPLVSRFHAEARFEHAVFFITDQASTNGTFVNGKRIAHTVLVQGDVVQIGPFRLLVHNNTLVRSSHDLRISLEAHHVTAKQNGKILLSDVSLSIAPGEFIAILGPSGAGKSTLAAVLTGLMPAASGAVYVNGFELHEFGAALNACVAMVAQQNVLHALLTVAETLHEQSLLRLPRDFTAAERCLRVERVLQLLDLQPLANRYIGTLSGGEAKRVHLGMELIAEPPLIFCDEPFAGLDPGLIHSFMKLFRTLADRGHTILLATHTLEQLDCCDRVCFLNKGKLLYAGAPSAMAQTLNATSLCSIYELARAGGSAIAAPAAGPVPRQTAFSALAIKPIRPRTVSLFRQYIMLVVRFGRMVVRDRRNLIIQLAQAPLLASMLWAVFGNQAFLPLSFYFCCTLCVIWIGGINAVREIAREWPMLRRELRGGLSVYPYWLAKVTVCGSAAILQSMVFMILTSLLLHGFEITPALAIILGAGALCGSLMGLVISAWSSSVAQAIAFLPIVFIPQIFFSGILLPFDRMVRVGEWLSYATVARPIFALLKKSCFLKLPVFNFNDWAILLFLAAGLAVVAVVKIAHSRAGR